MAGESFELDLTIKPGAAVSAAKTVGDQLERTERQAFELKQALIEALAQRDRGTQAALRRVNETLERTEERAIVTDARIGQIGRDIQPRGIQNVNRELKKTSRIAGEVQQLLLGAFAGLSIRFVVREYAALSDEFTLSRNRIGLVTEGMGELNRVQGELFKTANDTRTSYEATSIVFTRLAANQKELGVSTDRLISFTRSLNQAVQLSGATAQESRNALIQLSQGIAAGALRGDELRSVLEQLPAVADVIAKKLGVTRGQLRQLGNQGKITADIIIDAFEEASGDLEAKFGKTVPTLGQSFTTFGNVLLKNVGYLNQVTGASEKLSRSLLGLAKLIDVNDVEQSALNRSNLSIVGSYQAVNLQIESLRRELTAAQNIIRTASGDTSVAEQRAIKLGAAIDALTESQRLRREEAQKAAKEEVAPRADSSILARITALQEEQRLLGLSNEERSIQKKLGQELSKLKKGEVDLTKKENAEAVKVIENLIRQNAEIEKQTNLREKAAREAARKAAVDPAEGLQREIRELEIVADKRGIARDFALLELEAERRGVELTKLKRGELLALLRIRERLVEKVEAERKAEADAAAAERQRVAEAKRAEQRVASLRQQVDVVGQLKAQEEELLRLREHEFRDIIPQVDEAVRDLRLRQLEAAKDLESGFDRAFEKLKRESEDLASVGEDVVNVFADRATDAIVEFTKTGELSFKKFASAVLEDITRILVRLLVVKSLSALGGGLGFGIPTNTGAQFGATVQPGQAPRPVGENGPELFVPNRTGTIVPNPKDQRQPERAVNLTSVVLVDMEQLVPDIIAGGVADEALVTRVGANRDRISQVQQ